MNRKCQEGVVTLLMTSVLLIVTLAVTLGTYKALFYQIKRAKNEIRTRQNHWLAEGAVECAFTQFRENNLVPQVVTDCGSGQGIIASFHPTPNGQRVFAQAHRSSVQKDISVNHRVKPGALQSSADLYFHSSVTFSTPDPGKLSPYGWECVALRYRHRLYAPVIDNKGVVHGKKPYQGFDNPMGKDCMRTHQTRGSSRGTIGKDFVKDEHIPLFEQFFHVPAQEHDRVKQREKITVIEGLGADKRISNCGSILANHIRSGKHYLWVEGSCEIKRSEYNQLVNATASTEGVLILVHDGIFSVMGKPEQGATSQSFKGVLFHFNSEFVAHPSKWQSFEANRYLNHVPSVVANSYRKIATYYQHGAFTFSGGQYFDTPGQAAVFYDSVDFQFNRDVIDNVQTHVNPPRWKQGSWYAL